MRKLWITLGIVLVLLVGVDLGGRAVAESQLSKAFGEQARMTPAPEVDIHGFSFLWQVLSGNYSHATVSATNAQVDRLSGVSAVVEGFDIQFPLSAALSADINQLTIGRADLNARIPLSELAAVLGGPELTVTAGSNGALRISTTANVAGRSVPVSVDATMAVADGALKVTAAPPTVEGLPADLASRLALDLSASIPLDALPLDIAGATVRTEGDSVVVTGSVRDIKASEFS